MGKLMLLMTLLLSGFSLHAQGIKLISNSDNQQTLTRDQVRQIYMGAMSADKLTPLALTPTHNARVVFNIRIIGLTESRIQAYWAQMRFTGRSKPPLEFSSPEALVEHLMNTPGTIGYVPADMSIPANLKVILQVQ